MGKRNRRTVKHTTRATSRWRVLWKFLFCVVFLSFLVLNSYRFVRGFQSWWRNREIRQGYARETERLTQERQRLKEQIDKLEHSPLAQERLAREMGYIKPGETVYKLVPQADGNVRPRSEK